jgi:hypothetical protein
LNLRNNKLENFECGAELLSVGVIASQRLERLDLYRVILPAYMGKIRSIMYSEVTQTINTGKMFAVSNSIEKIFCK